MGKMLLIALLFGTFLGGCGSVDWFPTIGADDPASVVVTTSNASPVVGASVTITATVKKADGTAVVDGTAVSFTTVGGSLDKFSATTTGGIATVTLTSPSAISCTVTASSGIVSGRVTVAFVSGVTVAANPSSAAIGISVTITATANKSDGTPVADGTTVTFAAPNGGSLSAATATTTAGKATVTFSNSFAGTFTVTATVGSDTASTFVSFF